MQEYLLDKEYEFDVIFKDEKIFSKKAFGKLKLSQSGIILDVICRSDRSINTQFNKVTRILHCITVDKQKITIYNAIKIGYKGQLIPDNTDNPNSKINFIAQYCIIGDFFDEFDKDCKIKNLHIKQNNLIQWIDESIIEHSFNKNENSETFEITHKPSFYKTEIKDIAKIDFYISATTNLNSYENPSYTVNYWINYDFYKQNSINECLEHIKHWEILYSLFMGQSYNIDAICFKTDTSISNSYLYYIRDKKYPYNLHYLEVPLPCDKIKELLSNIMNTWYCMDDKIKRSATLFYRAINSKTNNEEGFLNAIKAVEGFADKYNDVFFEEKYLKESIIPEIKKCLKNLSIDNKSIKNFSKSLKYTNKFKYNLEDRINKLSNNYNLDFLNLNNDLLSHLVSYRNTLSHNGGEEKYKKIDTNILYEGYLKFTVALFILFMLYIEIPIETVNYAISRNHFLRILQDNKLLK